MRHSFVNRFRRPLPVKLGTPRASKRKTGKSFYVVFLMRQLRPKNAAPESAAAARYL
jgi:hypothetical protein